MSLPFVVIGAGAGGMTTALILARRGERVVLVESAPAVAPLLRGFIRDGVRFDTGFHYAGGLDADGALTRFFRYLGLAEAVQPVPFATDGFDLCRFADGAEFRFPLGEASLGEALGTAFPGEGNAIGRYLALLRQAWEAFPYMNLDAPVADAGLLDGPSLQQVLDAHFTAPRLKELLSLHCLLHGAAADEIPFALHACIVGPYYRSVHGIAGGGGALAKAFSVALATAGVEIRCGEAVANILCSAVGTVSGVRLASGEEIPCRGCVATLHPRLLPALLPPGVLRPAYCHRLERLEESAGGLVLFANCAETPELLRRRNLFLSPRGGRFVDGPIDGRPLYLSGSESGPGGGGFLAILPLSVEDFSPWRASRHQERPVAYDRCKKALTEEVLARLQREVPAVAGTIRTVAAATPLTYRDYVASPYGSLYGVKHRVGQLNPQTQTRARGLYLAGQATAAPGVLGAMLSGFLACGTIFGHESLRQELKKCA
jgi:all-trans-retinol 13,14-reductase